MAKKRRQQYILVIDIGTTSIRASIAEYRRRQITVLEDISAPVDLSIGLRGGVLDHDTMDEVERIIVDMNAAAQNYEVGQVRIVGTTSLREAINSDALVERLRSKHDLCIEIIDSAEECRVYNEGLRALAKKHSFPLRGTNVLLDVGGGATSTSIIRGGQLIFTADEPFGTFRVIDLFRDLRDRSDWARTVERFTHGAVRMIIRRMSMYRIKHVFINGPEIRHVARLMGVDTEPAFMELKTATIEAWVHDYDLKPLSACAAEWQCSEQEAQSLVPAAFLLRELARETQAEHFIIPNMHLRDGLLADLTPGSYGPQYLGRRELLAAAKQMSLRYGMDIAYAENTANLAAQIFDQTEHLHNLTDRDRVLLEFAAWVHDIGSFLNVHNRHLHTRYIIENAVIAGITELEKKTIAHVARYHRRDHPGQEHDDFYQLPRSVRVQIAYLASILRLAYALDVERMQRITKVHCEVHERRFLVHVDRRQIALERWSIATRSDMFEEVFGLAVQIIPRDVE